MATTLSSIPNGASLIEGIYGTIDAEGEENHGRAASVEIYTSHVGDAIAEWLVIRVESPDFKIGWAERPYFCKRATGKNIAKLHESLEAMRPLIKVVA